LAKGEGLSGKILKTQVFFNRLYMDGYNSYLILLTFFVASLAFFKAYFCTITILFVVISLFCPYNNYPFYNQLLIIMKVTLFLIAVLFSVTCFGQKDAMRISVIPQPVSMELGKGTFTIKPGTTIEIDSHDSAVVRVADFLSRKLRTATGYTFSTKHSTKRLSQGNINFILSPDSTIEVEGYRLSVTSADVTITAHQAAGFFYGMQTLLQLLPKEIESKTIVHGVQWAVPSVTVVDKPRFGWRGLMFDVSRHFLQRKK
jgi:hexosaminidase